jgi:hypothetical protein
MDSSAAGRSHRHGRDPEPEDLPDVVRRSQPSRRRTQVSADAEPPAGSEAWSETAGRVNRTRSLLGYGHLVDPADRPAPRFPQSRVPWVTQRIRDALDDWRIGAGTTVVTGGARGADIIIAEEAHSRGAALHLCLALPPEEFERVSVHLPGTVWTARFRRLLRLALVVEVLPHGPDGEMFARTNAWMVELARELDPDPYAIVVWDGRPGDGPDGTADLVKRLGYPAGHPRLRVIDPTPARRVSGH